MMLERHKNWYNTHTVNIMSLYEIGGIIGYGGKKVHFGCSKMTED
jgi:hypothetical protein